MKKGNRIIIYCFLLCLWSCEIEPFEPNSLTEFEEVDVPSADDTTQESEDPSDDQEESIDESEFTTGQLRYEIDNRSFVSIQNNGTIDIDRTTIVGIDKETGERINISFIGNGMGNYVLNDINLAIYYTDFLESPYSTAFNQGSGSLEITRYDLSDNQIDGFFQFTAFRELRDVEGNLVLDSQGDIIFEVVEIVNGEFEMVPLN